MSSTSRRFLMGALAVWLLAGHASRLAGKNTCAGGCPRTELMIIEVPAVGVVEGTLYGFTDADYGLRSPGSEQAKLSSATDQRTSCAQPGHLRTTRFEFAGNVAKLGPVRIWLDPRGSSGGMVAPRSLPKRAAEIQPAGGLFPADNEMSFHLRLDIPDLGLQLVNAKPLRVKTSVSEWPPPAGTSYNLLEPVEFVERDPGTGAPRGPVQARLRMGSRALFYPAGNLEVTMQQARAAGSRITLSARVSSRAPAPLTAVWHAHTRESILTLGRIPTAAAELGPRAGTAALPARGSKAVEIPVQMKRPGSEAVFFFAGTSSGKQVFGNRASVRAVLPDRGLAVASVESEKVVAGSSAVLRLKGTGFVAPFGVSVNDPNVKVRRVTVTSPGSAEVTVDLLSTAAPGERDLTVSAAGGRQFLFVDAFTVLWPRPRVTRVTPARVRAGEAVTLEIQGDFFLDPSFVSLGSNVTVQTLQRVSRDRLRVVARGGAGFQGPVDVIVVGANGSAALANGLALTR